MQCYCGLQGQDNADFACWLIGGIGHYWVVSYSAETSPGIHFHVFTQCVIEVVYSVDLCVIEVVYSVDLCVM